MIIPFRQLPVVTVALASLIVSACDGGARSRTADEFAADSALAADLALANRDTLLVDSIGAYREPMDMGESDDSVVAIAPGPAPAAAPAPAPAPPPAPVTAVAPPAPAPATAAQRR